MTRTTVAVAMSGGVDSSVAALILKRTGYNVIGITMRLFGETQEPAIRQAASVATILGIEHRVTDLSGQFQTNVIDYFCEEYSQGLTPNPCVACNKLIKFGALLQFADSIGAEYLATGQYAQIRKFDLSFHLYKARDLSKDQSYFLYRLNQEQLGQVLLPLGDLTKNQVRNLAKESALPVFPGESQDICFLQGEDYRSFLKGRVESIQGDIVDEEGKIVGFHRGIAYYTIGQRQGLGVASNVPLYVVAIDNDRNRVVLGSEKSLLSTSVFVKDLNWISGTWPTDLAGLSARIRYRMPDIPVTVLEPVSENVAKLTFVNPVRAVTPGQSLVVYRCDEVLGGGIIAR
jgi:tRNA-uridine 2-sulfurtransferase